MPARTGKDYIDRLNQTTPAVYIDGERIGGPIADHPSFRGITRTYGRLYDMQHETAIRETLTFASPSTGDAVPVSFLAPRSREELVRRRKGMELQARMSHGFLGRTGDYMNSCLTALEAAEAFFSKADPIFGERLKKYVEYMRENDLLAAHSLIPPQVNRAVPAAQQGDGRLAARVVDEREDGIIVRGARMLATIAPIADELLVFPSTVLRNTPEDAAYSFAFAIPCDTPGLKFYCRAPLSYGRSHFDEPLASQFDEPDGVVVFDDVFVPNDRIFLLGDPQLCNTFYTATGAGQLMTHQVAIRTLVKTEFYLGLAASVADSIGIGGFQHVQQDLAELITYVEIQKALIHAAEAKGDVSDDGIFLPEWNALNAARNWFPTQVAPRLSELVRKLSASGLMALPSEADFAGDGSGHLETYLQSSTLDAKSRAQLMKVALDASVSGFAGRQGLYEYFFFGDPVRLAEALVSAYDLGPARENFQKSLTIPQEN
ncbi:4-hydroxyphenylacetate 3-monooxygenase, oxygenase component [Paenarthrobacter sp. NPDC090520]|uniref:4-hydroxyphenylacetate 3-monooxygenase, oxygenase component n=1 Tax=Paenarthrobacter sp. NPDC090520 TaxID=3364382 RepID=UPI00381CF393